MTSDPLDAAATCIAAAKTVLVTSHRRPDGDGCGAMVALTSMLRRLGRSEQSREAYDRAIGLAGNTAETAYLIRRRDQLASP